MTITCDTSLDSILNSDDVNTIISTASSNVRDCTRPRRANVVREIGTDGIKNAIIGDSNVMYTKGVEVKDAYGTFHTSLIDLENTIKLKAKNKEIEELTELIGAIKTKISSLESSYDAVVNSMRYEEDEIELVNLEKKATRLYNSIESYKTKKEAAEERLKKRDSSYQPSESDETDTSPNASGLSHEQHTEYNISSGDKFTMNGQQYEFLWAGKDADGNVYQFVFDENYCIMAIGPDGTMTDTGIRQCDPYGTRLVEQYQTMEFYDSYSTNNANAAALGLPPQDSITPGESGYEPTVCVDYGEVNPADVTHANNSTELHDAAANHAPVITIDATQLEDNQKWWQNLLGGSNDVDAYSGSSQITLVYNESTGMYYPMDNNGYYHMDMYCELTPEKLQNYTIEN